MKLFCVGKTASSPCLVLQFRGATVMLDCALDMSSAQYFTPLVAMNNEKVSYGKAWSSRELEEIEGFISQNCLKEISGKIFIDSEPEVCSPEDGLLDFSHIDVILISNYHFMLALPFISEFSKFSGKIFATDPTLQLGRELMLEMVSFAERVPKPSKGTMWKESDVLRCLPSPLCDLTGVKAWRKMYSKRDVKACISKIETVGYNEKLDLFGVLELKALSSGFCIGSCNWVLQSHYEKISYVSSSSTFTTHPLPMDQSELKGCDVMILAGMTEAPTANPDGMLGEFCTQLANTVKNGGNVLVPCYPAGVLYDLFECLQSYMDSASLSSIPIYFISPVADSSLAYSNIFAEWLCQSKQSKVYLPEPPFPHGELVKNGRLKHFSSLHEGLSNAFKTPCVVFCGHPSLRFGDAVHFMELWGKSSGNTVIFTEPDFPYLEALAPFQPLAMKACYCPIDPRINFSQANKLIREIKPGHLVVSESYTRPPSLLPHRSDLVIQDVECKVSTYNFLEVLSLPVTREYEKVALSTSIAENIHPQEVRPGIAAATVTGTLVTKDNRYTLEPLEFTAAPGTDSDRENEPEPKRLKALSRHLWGTVIVDDLLQAMEKKGIKDVHVESNQDGVILHLADDDAMIQLERGSTHIITHGNEGLRQRIRDAFMDCVSHF